MQYRIPWISYHGTLPLRGNKENDKGANMDGFERELSELINRHNKETAVSNTLDYILARYIVG